MFLGIHCSHLFLSYPNTMGLMIFKSSHMLIFFLLLARISFVPACYPDSLHPYIATENSFFLFFFFYERSCLTLGLISPSKCPSPVFSSCRSWMHQQFHLGRCLISWKDAGSAIRDLSLPSNIAPSLKSKYSLVSLSALFSSIIFWGAFSWIWYQVHLLAQGSTACGCARSLWMQCGALAFWGTALQEGFADCSSCLFLSSRLGKSRCPAWKQIPAGWGGSSYQLLLGFSWHPGASGKEKPGMALCEDCQPLT